MFVSAVHRIQRAARRYVTTGRFRCAPSPMIDGFFGGKDCFFVQVGSNDGAFRDPLHDLIKTNPRWRGLFIEPQEEPFGRLIANYANDRRFAFEQIAISDAVCDRTLYFARGLTREMSAISSFDRSHVLKHSSRMTLKHDPSAYISEMRVRCEPLMYVLSRHCIEQIDLMHIDAEAYDYQVLRQLDFRRFRPKLILYEHNALTDQDRRAAEMLLRNEGYRLVNCRIDTLAVRGRSQPPQTA